MLVRLKRKGRFSSKDFVTAIFISLQSVLSEKYVGQDFVLFAFGFDISVYVEQERLKKKKKNCPNKTDRVDFWSLFRARADGITAESV